MTNRQFRHDDRFDELLHGAVHHVVDALSGTCAATSVKERLLQNLVAARLSDIAGEAVSREATSGLAGWPNAGDFDLRVGDDAVIELKWWGSATSKRYETLWDACKVANAVEEGVAERGYLISGGRSTIWARDDEFIRLFDSREHETIPLCIPAANWWKSPVNDTTTVTRLLSTTSIASVAFAMQSQTYELRCARVRPCGARVRVPRYVSQRVRKPKSGLSGSS